MNQPPRQRSVIELINEALRLQHAGAYAQSEPLLRAALQVNPRHPDALYALGWVLGQMCREAEGLEALRKAAAADPRRAQTWHEIGILHQNAGEPTPAVEAFERAMFLNPRHVESFCACALMLERDRKPDKARAVLQRALKHNPADPQVRMMLAAMNARDKATAPEAERVLREVIASAPNDDVRFRALSALNVALESQARHIEAFDAAAECNRIRRTRPSVKNMLAASDWVVFETARSYTAVTAEMTARWAAQSFDDNLPTPAFVVGFPRSGTTMTENALGAHPAIVALDEPPTVNDTETEARRLLDPQRNPSHPHDPETTARLLDQATPQQVAHLRAYYWQRVAEVTKGALTAATAAANRTLLVDKNPFTIYRLALMNRLFPKARVVCVIRDPRDCCISAFTQLFRANPAMVLFTDLDDTARTYAAVMDQWLTLRPRLSTPILQVRYEDTVADFPTYARRLIDFLGLEWNDAVLAFEERAAKKFVSTPSAHAVTKKVNTAAVARYKRYADRLDPILPQLTRFIAEFGYEA